MSSTAPDASEEQDETVQLLAVLRRGKWWFLACVLLLPAAVYFYSESLPKTYTASTTVTVGSVVNTGVVSQQSSTASVPLARVARLTKTSVVAREAAQRFIDDPPQNPAALLGQIAVEGDDKTGLLTITASDTRPDRAADIANAFGETLIDRRRRATIDQINRAVAAVRENLDQVPRSDVTERRRLAQELQRLRALSPEEGDDGAIVEPAVAPSTAATPHPRRNTILALIVAVLLGLALVTLLDRLDRRIRKPSEMEDLLGAPLLATVPREGFPGQKPSSSALEAFGRLRTSLTYFNIDRRLETVLVTSGVREDGKSTVSSGLVVAAAKAGRRVIAVDTDLRRGQLAALLGVSAESGLSDVLVGERSISEALVEVPGSMGLLRVLPSGPVPPNPSELIGSQQMRELLETLAGMADLVVLDTSPLLVVSDAIPLLEQTSGTVVVGRLDQSTRDGLRRLRQILVTARGTVLGVVATNAKAGLAARDGYGYESYHDKPKALSAPPILNGVPASNQATPEPAPAPDTEDEEEVAAVATDTEDEEEVAAVAADTEGEEVAAVTANGSGRRHRRRRAGRRAGRKP